MSKTHVAASLLASATQSDTTEGTENRLSSKESPVLLRLLYAEVILLIAIAAVFASHLPNGLLPVLVCFLSVLVALAVVDIVSGRLPNLMTGVFALLGIASAILAPAVVEVTDAVFGMAAGLIVPAGTAFLFRLKTGKSGLGGGDVKFLGAAGAWVGWDAIPALVILASSAALFLLFLKPAAARHQKIAFGPSLALATMLLWVWKAAA